MQCRVTASGTGRAADSDSADSPPLALIRLPQHWQSQWQWHQENLPPASGASLPVMMAGGHRRTPSSWGPSVMSVPLLPLALPVAQWQCGTGSVAVTSASGTPPESKLN